MKDSFARYFAGLTGHLSVHKNRYWLLAGIAAACILLIVASLLIVTALPFGQRDVVAHAPVSSTGTPGSATTVAPTLTAPPAATKTAATGKPVSIVHAPPPPPIPTAPTSPTATICPTPTGLPIPTPTNTAVPSPTGTATVTTTAAGTSGQLAFFESNCQQCPYYSGNNPSQSQIQSALYAAADLYHLPRNLLLAVAWQESTWHEDVTSCDGGIGLMQIQYYTYPWLNSQSAPECGLSSTSYVPSTLQGNADLGAKFLAWLSCFYSFWGNNGGSSLASPGVDTIDWYYQQAHLQYPDTLNANGTPNSQSLCAAVFNDPGNPEYAALPSTTSAAWSCPYSATAGDATLLDFTLSAYNEGPGYTDQYGIQNWGYVDGVEGFIPQFAAGTLPS